MRSRAHTALVVLLVRSGAEGFGRRALVVASILMLAVTGHAAPVEAKPKPVFFETCDFTTTKSGTFKLIKELLDCPANGVNIAHDNVTIDLGGFVLGGQGIADTWGINNTTGKKNLRVRNGILRKFARGINALGDHLAVRSVTAVHNNYAGFYVDGENARFKSTRAFANQVVGFEITGDGVRISGGGASSNGGLGMNIAGDDVIVDHVEVANNGGNGILMSTNSGVIRSTAAIGNGAFGIGAGNGAACESLHVSSSRATGNRIDGMSVGCVNSSITSSVANANGLNGIKSFQLGGRTVIDRNRADGNGFELIDGSGYGIVVEELGPGEKVRGHNHAVGNDALAECDPVTICS